MPGFSAWEGGGGGGGSAETRMLFGLGARAQIISYLRTKKKPPAFFLNCIKKPLGNARLVS
jgi:hypothetical protein